MFPRNGLYSTDSALPQIPQPWPRDNHTEKLSAPFSTSHAPGNIPFQSPRHQAAQSNSSRPPAGFPVMMLHQPPPYPKYPHPHHLLSSSHLHGDSSMTNDTLSASDSGAQFPHPLNLSPPTPRPRDFCRLDANQQWQGHSREISRGKDGSGLHVLKKKKKPVQQTQSQLHPNHPAEKAKRIQTKPTQA